MSCLFCDLVSGSIPANKVYEDDEVLAFRDIHLQVPIHILIILKHHVVNLNSFSEADELLLGKLLLTVKTIARDLGVAEDGYRVNTNTNGDAGQTVYHLLAGRQFRWPPG